MDSHICIQGNYNMSIKKKKIHPIAFIIGSSINPTVHPQFHLYKYNVKNTPKYSKAFEIN